MPSNSLMKIFAAILSLYILALSIKPCIDIHKENMLQKIGISENSASNAHNETDDCSPFCSCACCNSSVLHQVFAIQFSCFSFYQKHFPKFQSSKITSSLAAIWQPPKL